MSYKGPAFRCSFLQKNFREESVGKIPVLQFDHKSVILASMSPSVLFNKYLLQWGDAPVDDEAGMIARTLRGPFGREFEVDLKRLSKRIQGDGELTFNEYETLLEMADPSLLPLFKKAMKQYIEDELDAGGFLPKKN